MTATKTRRKAKLNKIDAAQKFQIDYCEELGKQLPHCNGVPLVQALTYELMSILNMNAVDEK